MEFSKLDLCKVHKQRPIRVVRTFSWFSKRSCFSKARDKVLILTSDGLYQLDRQTLYLTNSEDKPQYQNLAVAPNGDFILADYYEFEKVTVSIKK